MRYIVFIDKEPFMSISNITNYKDKIREDDNIEKEL